MHVMDVRPAHPRSYERVFHAAGCRPFFLPLRDPARDEVRDELEPPRLERAIGVVYRPDTELQSHYFHATLPHQFDEYVWFDETSAVRPVTEARRAACRGASVRALRPPVTSAASHTGAPHSKTQRSHHAMSAARVQRRARRKGCLVFRVAHGVFPRRAGGVPATFGVALSAR